MAQFLFIRLGSHPNGPVSWAVAGSQGELLGPVAHGELADAAAQASGRKVVVLVPGPDSLVTVADVPVRGQARQLQAAPFALEDYIAQDVSDMHFAVGTRRPDGKLPVAAIERATLQAALGPLRDLGIEVAAVYSEAQGTPLIPGAVTALVERDSAMIRLPSGEFLAVEPDMLQAVMAPLMEPAGAGDGQQGDTGSAPPRIMIYLEQASQAQAPWMQALLDAFPAAETRQMADGPMAHIAATLLKHPGINFLQGDFAPVSDWHKLLRPWRAAALAAAVLVVVASTVPAVTLWRLSAHEAKLDAAIETVFRQAFPGISRIDNPRRQLDQQLLALRGSGTGASSEFLQTVIALGNVMPAMKESRVEAASYRNRVLSLQVRTPDVTTLDQLKRNMEQQGNFTVTIQSANPEKDGIEGRVDISRSTP